MSKIIEFSYPVNNTILSSPELSLEVQTNYQNITDVRADFFIEEKFTIAVIPDAQYYTCGTAFCKGDHTEKLNEQIQWIVDNREKHNIQYVTQTGDLVQTYVYSLTKNMNSNNKNLNM